MAKHTTKPNIKKTLREGRGGREGHGGARPHAGRPPKENKADFVTVCCVLRRDTVDQLRNHGRRRLFGPYLQWVLDRYPLPTEEEYQAARANKALVVQLPNRRRVPMIISAGEPTHKKRPLKPEMERFLAAYDAIDADGDVS
jgi:hypothetical protein